MRQQKAESRESGFRSDCPASRRSQVQLRPGRPQQQRLHLEEH